MDLKVNISCPDKIFGDIWIHFKFHFDIKISFITISCKMFESSTQDNVNSYIFQCLHQAINMSISNSKVSAHHSPNLQLVTTCTWNHFLAEGTDIRTNSEYIVAWWCMHQNTQLFNIECVQDDPHTGGQNFSN